MAGETVDPDWQQGSLLPVPIVVPTLQWIASSNPETKVGRKSVQAAQQAGSDVLPDLLVGRGPRKDADRAIVLTQTCDLVKSTDQLPQLEVARVFTTSNHQTIRQAQDFGSSRYFRLDPAGEGQAQILDYGQRALVEKGILRAFSPDNSVLHAWNDSDRELFARWLGQRYARAAIPDEDYELITRPVREAWQALPPEEASRFNREYAEWRYRREEDGTLTLYVLSRDADPDPVVAVEVGSFLAKAIEPTYPGIVDIAPDWTYHRFTVADELSTRQINMEWASHDEGEAAAALPAS